MHSKLNSGQTSLFTFSNIPGVAKNAQFVSSKHPFTTAIPKMSIRSSIPPIGNPNLKPNLQPRVETKLSSTKYISRVSFNEMAKPLMKINSNKRINSH